MDYEEFLKTKIDIAKDSGFEVAKDEINKALKPHQRDAVIWALRGGKRALFESFGLGKTVQELEFCHQVIKKIGGKALIVCPLGVKQEFTHDAIELLGYVAPEYVRNMEEVRNCKTHIMITNYERVRDGDIEPTYFLRLLLMKQVY
jgi:DNA methylase N-4/N-6 domain protein